MHLTLVILGQLSIFFGSRLQEFGLSLHQSPGQPSQQVPIHLLWDTVGLMAPESLLRSDRVPESSDRTESSIRHPLPTGTPLGVSWYELLFGFPPPTIRTFRLKPARWLEASTAEL